MFISSITNFIKTTRETLLIHFRNAWLHSNDSCKQFGFSRWKYSENCWLNILWLPATLINNSTAILPMKILQKLPLKHFVGLVSGLNLYPDTFWLLLSFVITRSTLGSTYPCGLNAWLGPRAPVYKRLDYDVTSTYALWLWRNRHSIYTRAKVTKAFTHKRVSPERKDLDSLCLNTQKNEFAIRTKVFQVWLRVRRSWIRNLKWKLWIRILMNPIIFGIEKPFEGGTVMVMYTLFSCDVIKILKFKF